MKVELLDLKKLVPYARNPRITAHAVDKVAASIKEFGFRQPITEVADRFEEAVRTLRRLPKQQGQGFFNVWPPIVRTVWEQMAMEKMPLRHGPPLPDAISRMEETFTWIFLLEHEEERRIIWLRAESVRWKQICWRIGIGKTKARELWTLALLKITYQLNG